MLLVVIVSPDFQPLLKQVRGSDFKLFYLEGRMRCNEGNILMVLFFNILTQLLTTVATKQMSQTYYQNCNIVSIKANIRKSEKSGLQFTAGKVLKSSATEGICDFAGKL